jgi:hypothetical protein
MTEPRYRVALDPPTGSLTLIDRGLVRGAVEYSRQSPRRRVIQPFHKQNSETLHRMLNAVQPDSYVFFTFDDDGSVTDSVLLSHDGDAFGVDLVPGIYHTFVALEPDTVIYEVKDGPYVASNDKSFAPWAPAEGDPAAPAYMARLLELHNSR